MQLTKLATLISLMIAFEALSVIAQDGSIDFSFDPGSGVEQGFSPNVYSVSLQSDGKIIIGGDFSSYNGTPRNHIARLRTDGSIDPTFNPGSGVAGSSGPSLPPYVAATAVQQDGKILIGGRFFYYNGTGRNQFARLNDDGTLDTSFDPGSGPNNYDLHAIAIQPDDGKILIGGVFTAYDNINCNRIARINPDGSLDNTFGGGVTGDGTVHTIVVQPDGRIIVGGYFSSYNNQQRNNIVRLNSDGTLDNTFSAGTGAQGSVYSISMQSDGKIIIGGTFITYNGVDRMYHARLNSDGTLDNSFVTGIPNNPNLNQSSFVRSTAVQADGKIIIAGEFTFYDNNPRGCIARLNTDGSIDTAFNPGSGAVWGILSTAIQHDGRILIGGNFTSYNGTNRSKIARLYDSEAPSAVYEQEVHYSLVFYPVPAMEEIIIKGDLNDIRKLRISDMTGREMLFRNISDMDKQEQLTLPLIGLTRGTYLLSVEGLRGLEKIRFIKN